MNVNSGTAGLSHGGAARRSSPASASNGVSSRGNGLWSMDGGSGRLSGGGSGGAGNTRSASSSRAASSASPLGCEWSPRDTGDAFVRGCVLQGLSAQSCADGLQEELRRCHPEYQSWFAKVHDVNSREITRCECDFCHGNTIEHFHYDIASQRSMCRRSLSSIPSNLCSRPFREVWGHNESPRSMFCGESRTDGLRVLVSKTLWKSKVLQPRRILPVCIQIN